ncbi:MAG: AMP-binding protein [bacterium]|nr:AMP-binding protein [bacterium]
MNVYSFLDNSAKNHPDNIAVVYRGQRVDYTTLLGLVNRLSNVLSKYGLKKGDRVILLLDNSIDYVMSYFAILKVGGVVVALNTDTTDRDVRYVFDSCQPKGVITNKLCCQYLPDDEGVVFKIILDETRIIVEEEVSMVEVDEKEDIAQIIYTSGTVGKPKGVMLTHLNLRSNAESIVEYLHLTSDDKIMVVLPFFYSYGNSLLLTHILAGGTLIISHQFVFLNKMLEMMIEEKATGFAGVPSSYAMLLHKSNVRGLKFPHLRYMTCAGGALSPANIVEMKKILPDVDYCAMYGQTEATARLSYLEPEMWLRKLGSAGKAIPGVKIRVVDKNGKDAAIGEVGEIAAQGLNIMKGYWGQPEETQDVLRDNWLHTGDIARIDEDGYIFIAGRQSDMIKAGAFRIHPQEIEDIITEISDVAECAVTGIPDEIMGEMIKAFVVLKADTSLIDKDILRYCKKNLPEYKIPRAVEFVSSLPKTTSGKIKRYVLKMGGRDEEGIGNSCPSR